MQLPSEVIKQIESNINLEFLPTGFNLIDKHLDGGFLRKELIVIGGQTGIGKSLIAGQIMWNMAKKGFKTSYFSLEISNLMLVSRLIGSLSDISPIRIFAGLLDPEEYEKKTKAKALLLTYENYMAFYDNIYDLAQIQEEIRKNNYEFTVIDFIQNVFIPNMDEYTRLSTVALELQKLAKDTNSCILVLSQLSNTVVREGNKSLIAEYKGSGSIATVCDLGFFIERSNEYEENRNMIRLNLKKNRRGISQVYFDLTYNLPGGVIC